MTRDTVVSPPRLTKSRKTSAQTLHEERIPQMMIRGALSRTGRVAIESATAAHTRRAIPCALQACYPNRVSTNTNLSRAIAAAPHRQQQQTRALSYEFMSRPGFGLGGGGGGRGGGGGWSGGGLDLWPVTHANTVVNVCPQVLTEHNRGCYSALTGESRGEGGLRCNVYSWL